MGKYPEKVWISRCHWLFYQQEHDNSLKKNWLKRTENIIIYYPTWDENHQLTSIGCSEQWCPEYSYVSVIQKLLIFFIQNWAVFSLTTSCAAHSFHSLTRLNSLHELSMKSWTVTGVPHWPQFPSLKWDCCIVGSLWTHFWGSYDLSSHFWTVCPLLICLILTLYVHISNQK